MEEINVMLDEGAIMPTRAHSADAGLDLYTPEYFALTNVPGIDCHVIDTGVHMEIQKGYVGINTKQMEPIMDELKNGQYMAWYRRTMHNGNPYYVLKSGMHLRIAVLPIVFDDVFAAALDEIRAGMAVDALGRPKKQEKKENDD